MRNALSYSHAFQVCILLIKVILKMQVCLNSLTKLVHNQDYQPDLKYSMK